jgi:hypothetical protein
MTLGKQGKAPGVATKGATTKGPQMPNPPHAPTQTKGKGTKASSKGVTVKAGKHINATGNRSHGKGGK